ncbi:F-box only protein 42-like [Uranotaenia lowii]|uniref:F-box only protein 42-like n=1 Tax=Uranotaenia lowii TaxID=190385 RepID=UPI00247939AA|nr:F-box only protein 42-like [Uranotaenia lowii]
MATIQDLPDEILEFIMSLLPPYEDLDQCTIVCKRWTSLATNVRSRKKASLQKGLLDFNLCWREELFLTEPRISARFAHASALHRNSMYVFGGASSYDTTFNDLWRFDLSRREWIRPISKGTYPSPKAGASLISHGDQLVLFGGWRYSYTPFQMCTLFDELHCYNIGENRWTIHVLAFGPPPMTGHSVTIHRNKMIVFGGYQKIQEVLGASNDLWILDLENMVWKQPNVSDLKPPSRYGQFQMPIGDDFILVIGGTGGVNRIFNDAWLLDMRGKVWRWRSVQIKNKKGTVTHNWSYPACSIGKKVVVLGPTSPNDFQIVRQHRAAHALPPNMGRARPPPNAGERARHGAAPNIPPRQNLPRPPAPPPPPAPVVPAVSVPSSSRQPPEPRPGPSGLSPSSSSSSPQQPPAIAGPSRPLPSMRSPIFRHQDDDHLLPKRFNQSPPEPGHMAMAAFSVPPTNPPPQHASRERQLEGLRKMEEKFSAMRREKEQREQQEAAAAAAAKSAAEAVTPKRIKRNGLAIYVCDLSGLISDGIIQEPPVIEWLDTRNNGLIDGAPDHFTFSTMVSGNGELIVFGGFNKNSKDECASVTNSVHFLAVPTAVV